MARKIPIMRDQGGSIAILYGLVTLFLLLGFAALIVDLGALRSDRRAAQANADFAATAGASLLSAVVDGSPQEACQTAIRYFAQNTPEVDIDDINMLEACGDPGPGGDSDPNRFPNSDAACYTEVPYPERQRTTSVGAYEVTITWPVDVDGGDGYSDEVDGHRCERISVQVNRTRGFLFGGIAGLTAGHTGAPAIARAVIGESDEDVANLLILDKINCNALWAAGGGDVRLEPREHTVLEEQDDGSFEEVDRWFPGLAYLDSDGSTTSGTHKCWNNAAMQNVTNYTINADGGSSIIAEQVTDDDGNLVEGEIRLFALSAGDLECVDTACDQGDIQESYEPDERGIWPQPRYLPRRSNRTVADHTYNCQDDYSDLDGQAPYGLDWEVDPCTNGTEPHVDNIRDEFGTGATQPTGFEAWSDHYDCTVNEPVNTADDGFDVGTNWWIDCSSPQGLRIGDQVEIPGGNIVVRHGLEVEGGGEFVHNNGNVATAGSAWLDEGCDVSTSSACLRLSTIDHAYIYFAGPGGIEQSGGTPTPTMRLLDTAVILRSAPIDVTGGNLVWRPPMSQQGPQSGLTGPLAKLSLWSDREPPGPHDWDVQRLTGQGNMVLAGVFFTPNSQMNITGGGAGTPQDAQFFTWRLRVPAGGQLVVSPNPAVQLTTPSFEGVRLIR